MEADFSGYATKANVRCSDGRTITPEAFKSMDGLKVPLVWQHGHNSADNVLGHAELEARSDGIYAYGFFNDTVQGQNAKKLVQHEDITAMSIYANNLVEKTKTVLHGIIREVSLVLSGANPGALIDFVRLQHSDDPNDYSELDDEAVIYTGLSISHAKETTKKSPEKDEDEEEDNVSEKTVQDVYDSMSEEQKNVLAFMVGAALENKEIEQSDKNDETIDQSDKNDDDLTHQEGNDEMTHNVFEQRDSAGAEGTRTITHADAKGIMADALKLGSLKDAVEKYALQHGIESIDVLFPDAQNITNTPEFDKRRTEWVSSVLSGTRHTPFSRVKTITADLTQDEARAKGYVKGNYKKEEWFGVTKRTTTPTTIYKKQKLDRDDILDITDFDVVAWLKAEMRLMLEEEFARAVLIGDGRDVGHEDKIKDPVGASDGAGIRSIANDHELFTTTLYVNVGDANSNYEEVVDAVIDGMEFYKGTGTPTFFTTIRNLNMFLKAKDLDGRRYYKNKAEVAEALGVREIITVEPMNDEPDIVGIIVNLDDYNIGADKGGEVNLFDDFDIDYNQQKYLMETRVSGALTKVKSALVIRKTDSANVLVVPTKPTFVENTGVITIPTVTGVVYKDGGGTTLTAGAQTALTAGTSKVVNAIPASGYYFASTADDSWTFKRPAA
jgi:HK97 family phage prohead protease